jgi:hypothetical protein
MVFKNGVKYIQANLILFIATNIAGVLTHYPSEIAQRQAFMETRQCIQARLTTQKENQQQVNYLIFFFCIVLNCFNTREIGLEFINPTFLKPWDCINAFQAKLTTQKENRQQVNINSNS